mmetsp:Transcript_5796/g.10058  ORF Transcript_5796/g.10058 Transcript_5796/m.10058 type:complete len:782 (+) Transcript_5796:126-2471(+)
MAVAGFDVGNDRSCVALARKRGIDVLLNKESTRETPAVVNFGEKMRFMGTDGLAKQGLQPQNTVCQLKRLLGRKFADPAVQADLERLPLTVTEGPDGGCLINVQFLNESTAFTPEQCMAMVFVDLKAIAKAETNMAPVDCVVSVPVEFNEAQRYAMLNAIAIAGLNCLRLINENTATALAYGIFKTDLPETEPVHVAFVDVGHSSTQVSIVSLRKGGLQVLSHAWDDNLGGRDFDELLFDHFCAEFKTKHKIEIKTNKKASFKLRSAVDKVKKMLSANAEAPLNVECIMNDVDVRGQMTREIFEGLAQPLTGRFKSVLERALAQSGLDVEALSSVEVVGGSTRIPMLATLVEEVFRIVPSRTLNAKECVSRGAALQCAMLSPVFKVRDFEVIDACPYPVDFHWEKDGKPTSQRLFERGSPFPAAKMLTFLRSEPFVITAVNADTNEKLGDYTIGPFSVPAGHDTAKLKVKVRMNLHGLVSVESVQAIEDEEGQADVKMDEVPQEAGAAPVETEAGSKAAEASADGKKKKVRKVDVQCATSGAAGLTVAQLNDYFEKECQMQAADKLMEETADRKNAVESYVYKLRNGLHGALQTYVKAAEKEAILSKLQACEDWLYEDGEDCTKSVYVAKLDEMLALGNPVQQRAVEAEVRPAAVANLRTVAEGFLNWASSSDPRYAHIPTEDRIPIASEAASALAWLTDKVALQSALTKVDPPVLLTSDCTKKAEMLERLARPVLNRPVPKVTPTEAAPAEAAPAADSAPMETEIPSDGPASEEQSPMEP